MGKWEKTLLNGKWEGLSKGLGYQGHEKELCEIFFGFEFRNSRNSLMDEMFVTKFVGEFWVLFKRC